MPYSSPGSPHLGLLRTPHLRIGCSPCRLLRWLCRESVAVGAHGQVPLDVAYNLLDLLRVAAPVISRLAVEWCWLACDNVANQASTHLLGLSDPRRKTDLLDYPQTGDLVVQLFLSIISSSDRKSTGTFSLTRPLKLASKGLSFFCVQWTGQNWQALGRKKRIPDSVLLSHWLRVRILSRSLLVFSPTQARF